MSRLLAYGLGFGLVALSAAPAFRDPEDDSYPLSTYPMFARPRGKPRLSIVEGLNTSGAPVRLSPELVVVHDEVMQAAATVRRAVAEGPHALERLCSEVASRTASDADYQNVQTVRVVTARYDPVLYFSKGPEPEERVEHFRCAVPRPR